MDTQEAFRWSPDQLVMKVGMLTLENERAHAVIESLKMQLDAARAHTCAPCDKECCNAEAEAVEAVPAPDPA